MTEPEFTKWAKWIDRNNLSEVEYPGVYCIAKSESNLAKQDFDWIKEIEYVGMTNRQKLKDRLKQFDYTLLGKNLHGGASRCLHAYQNKGMSYQDLLPLLFVSVNPFECEIKSYEPKDLRIKGDIAKFEYDCIAKYTEKFNKLPEFNNPNNKKK
jgi:hypothetical protein